MSAAAVFLLLVVIDSLCLLGESGITIGTLGSERDAKGHYLLAPRHHRSLTVYANNADAGTLDPFRLPVKKVLRCLREMVWRIGGSN